MVYAPKKQALDFPPLLDVLPQEERWPAPPFAWDHEALDHFAVEPCRLRLRSGQEVDGEMVAFELLAGQIRFRRQAGGSIVAVPFAHLSSIGLTRPLQPQPHAGSVPTPEHERDVRIELHDGGVIGGSTVGRVESEAGQFLFPPVEVDRSVSRLFVPRSAYRRAEFGPTAVEAAAARWLRTPQALLEALARQETAPVLPMGQALLNLGLATTRQIERVLAQQTPDHDKPLGRMLVEAGIVSPPDLEAALAHKMGYPLVDVERFPVDPAATRKLTLRTVMATQALPLLLDGRRLVLAVASPSKVPSLRMLQAMSSVTPVPVLARRSALERALGAMASQDVWAPAVPVDTTSEHG